LPAQPEPDIAFVHCKPAEPKDPNLIPAKATADNIRHFVERNRRGAESVETQNLLWPVGRYRHYGFCTTVFMVLAGEPAQIIIQCRR
jgi:hypothetical protein